MSLTDFLEFAVYAFLGYAISVFVISTIKTYNKIKELEQKASGDILMEEVLSKLIIVNVEKHGDMFYLYEVGTDNFIAQGKTKDEIAEVCIKRFPTKLVVLNENQENDYGLANS
jgi:hypothetical protein